MRKIAKAAAGGAALAAFTSLGALAADMPVKAPIVAPTESSFYVVLDGSYQVIHLPKYELGWRVTAPVGASLDTGVAVHPFDPRPEGGAFSGAFGYRFKDGALAPLFGSNQRIEFGGFYVSANDSQSAAEQLNPRMALFPLSGARIGACGANVCSISSNLKTDYTGWQIFGKFAGDHRFGGLTVTPSISVFGGRTDLDQTLAQTDRFPPFTGGAQTYTANSSLQWTDVGAKVGLDGRIAVASWLALGLGGTIGVANREVSLNASDAYRAGAILLASSTLTGGTSTTAFLANAEARVFFPVTANVEIKAFVGLNYDDKVPGILKPTWTGDSGGPTSITPAGIRFDAQTSYYAGGGVKLKF